MFGVLADKNVKNTNRFTVNIARVKHLNGLFAFPINSNFFGELGEMQFKENPNSFSPEIKT